MNYNNQNDFPWVEILNKGALAHSPKKSVLTFYLGMMMPLKCIRSGCSSCRDCIRLVTGAISIIYS